MSSFWYVFKNELFGPFDRIGSAISDFAEKAVKSDSKHGALYFGEDEKSIHKLDEMVLEK